MCIKDYKHNTGNEQCEIRVSVVPSGMLPRPSSRYIQVNYDCYSDGSFICHPWNMVVAFVGSRSCLYFCPRVSCYIYVSNFRDEWTYLHLFRLWMEFAKLRRVFLIFFLRLLLCLKLKWNIHGFVSDDPSQSLCRVRKEYMSVTCNIPA